MFRAEVLWWAKGPTLKMEGRLVGKWAEQARRLVTTDLVPKGLIVDLAEVSYIDSGGERLLSWLGSVGSVFVASNVYAIAVCERLGLSLVPRTPSERHRGKEEKPQLCVPMQVDAGPAQQPQEEE